MSKYTTADKVRITKNLEDRGYEVRTVDILEDGRIIVDCTSLLTGIKFVMEIPEDTIELFL